MGKFCGLVLTGFLIIVTGPLTVSLGQTRGTGTISGKLTIGDKPAKGIAMSIRSGDPRSYPPKPSIASTTTDEDGKYSFSALAPGSYVVSPYQPANNISGTVPWDPGNKSVTLGDGETIDDLDFQMTRGGVITGRITGADGRPVIDQMVRIEGAEKEGRMMFGSSWEMYRTDDRGIYRIYGLLPDKYTVSVGEDKNSDSISIGITSSGYIPRTYYPGVATKAEATVVELSDGSEQTGINFAVGAKQKTFAISGRTIDGATGKPAPDVALAYGTLRPDGNSLGSFGSGPSMHSDSAGEFRLEGIRPGKYAVMASSMEGGDNRTGKPVPVEIVDNDVEGVELTVSQGATIDGIAAVEGSVDPTIAAKLTGMTISIFGQSSPGQLSAPNYRSARIAGDGSFHFEGLTPGKLRINVIDGGATMSKSSNGLSLIRIEQNGQTVPSDMIDAVQGSDNAPVRLVFEYATGVIRGQIVFPGGSFPPGARVSVSARRVDSTGRTRGAMVDARGHFVIEGLSNGSYELKSFAELPGSGGSNSHQGLTGSQTVTVTNGGVSETTLTLAPQRPTEVDREK